MPGRTEGSEVHGWVLAETADEAKLLSGHKNAIIKQISEHLWIARQRVAWETLTTNQPVDVGQMVIGRSYLRGKGALGRRFALKVMHTFSDVMI